MTDSARSTAGSSTAHKMMSGVLLLSMARWLVRTFGLVSTVVLARILTPEDFGLVAVATAYMGLLESFSGLPVTAALLNEGPQASALYPTAFSLQVIRGGLLAMLGLLGALAVPWLLDDPRLPLLFLVTAIQPLLAGFHNPRFSEMDRALDYRAETIRQVVGRAAAFVVTIVIALAHPTYWALIAGLLTSAAFTSASSYYLIPWRPRFGLQGWRRIVGFSGWVVGANMVRSVTERVDNLIVAKILDLGSTALYNVGKELPSMAVGELVGPLDRVLFPSLVRFRGDPEAMRLNTLRVFRAISTVSLTLGGLVALVSQDAVQLLYGAPWRRAAEVMPVVALALSAEMATNIATTVALVENRGAMLLRVAATRAAIRLPLFLIGASKFGLRGAAAGYAAGALISAIANLGVLRKVLNLSLSDLARALFASTCFALVSSGFVIAARAVCPSGDEVLPLGLRLGSAALISVLFPIALGGIRVYLHPEADSIERQIYTFVSQRVATLRGNPATRT